MDEFLGNLELSVKNKIQISLRNEFALFTLNVISKVSSMKYVVYIIIVNYVKLSQAI